MDLVIKRLDVAGGLLDRRLVAAFILEPAVVVFNVLRAAALLRFDLEAGLALVRQRMGLPDHFHATGLAGAVLGLTVLLEVAPLPVAAYVDVLLVEAHGDGGLGGVSALLLASRVRRDLRTGLVCVGVMGLLWRRIDWDVRLLLMLGQSSDVLMS